MSIQDLAVGKWNMESSDKFDEWMKAIGVGMATRLIANKLKPATEISVNGDEWTVKTISTFKNTEQKFKLGQEFDEVTPDGRNVKSTVTADGNKLNINQVGDMTTTMTREFSADTMTITMTAKDVTCTRVYKKA